MTIIQKLTLESLKKNKKRTIVTILGVLLSTALICAVIGLVMSGRASLIGLIRHTEGDFHALFQDVPAQDLPYVTENANVTQSHVFSELGYARLHESRNEYKPYYFVLAMPKDSFSAMAVSLETGRLPENDHEILVSKAALTNGGQTIEVGDTLTLDIGARVNAQGQLLGQYNEVDPEAAESAESIINTVRHEYTVVGIIERPSSMLEPFSAPGYTLITYADSLPSEGLTGAGVRFTNARQFNTYLEQIYNALYEADPDTTATISANETLLKLEGALKYSTLQALYALAAIILFIIVATSVFVIRNAFAISVSEKTAQYGMLASIGATSKQIRQSVLFEGLIIGLIGIPLGILLGIGAIAILLQVLNVLLSDMLSGMRFVFVLPLIVPILTIALGALTIYLSCLMPALKAGRIAPIVAIRGNQEVRIRAKSLRTSRLTGRLFGIGGVIASKNLKRSRSKYRTTVVSLVVSIATFIALSSFVNLGRNSVGYYYTDYQYNIALNGVNSEAVVQKITDTLECRESHFYWNQVAEIPGSWISDIEKETYEDMGVAAPETLYANILVMPDDDFAQYAQKVGEKGDPSQAAILLDETLSSVGGDGKTLHRLTCIEAGDTIPYQIESTDGTVTEADITITALAHERPVGYEGYYSSNSLLILPQSAADPAVMKDAYIGLLFVDAEDPDAFETAFGELQLKDPDLGSLYLNNLQKNADQNRRFILAIEIFLYGFIIVITLIGVTNIFNTITTNMMLRRKEFAMLRSVGMTDSEFRGMIRLENILYSLKSLAIGVPLGIAGSYLIYRAAAGELDLGYRFPWISILISVLFVLLVVGLTMRYSMRKISEQNIIETIRSDNI